MPDRSHQRCTRPRNLLRRRVHGPLFSSPRPRRGGPGRALDSIVVPPASASLYRRHRPRSFADVVGQEHVVRTLSNAIEQDKVHHAYPVSYTHLTLPTIYSV